MMELAEIENALHEISNTLKLNMPFKERVAEASGEIAELLSKLQRARLIHGQSVAR